MPLRTLLLLATIASNTGCAALAGISDPSDQPALFDLRVSTGVLTPAFDPDVVDYQLDLATGDADLAITATAGADHARITVAGAAIDSGGAADLRLELGARAIAIEVAVGDDTRTYTITAVRGARIAETAPGAPTAGSAGDRLGLAVAMSGDVVAVGAPATTATGSAYVVGVGAPITLGAALAVAGQPGDGLGAAVALGGDTLVVGAPGAGVAHVFERGARGWALTATLTAAEPRAGDRFGAAVALDLDGDRPMIAVGAPGGDAAHVFVRDGDRWGAEAVLRASNPHAGAELGASIAVSGDVIVVGAPARASSGSTRSGMAYVFVRRAGAWSENGILTPGAPVVDGRFGSALAVDGDTLVIGAPGEGAAYVYGSLERSVPDQRLAATDGDRAFGASVALGADLLVVGAPGVGDADRGAAAVYGRQDTTWSPVRRLQPGASRDGDRFGAAVAVSGWRIAVGAPALPPVAGTPAYAGALHRFE